MVTPVEVKQVGLDRTAPWRSQPRIIHSFATVAFAAAPGLVNPHRMSADRIASALARIEAAARRIETAGLQSSDAEPELARRYDVLQREAGQVLEQLDLLIDGLEA